VGSPPASLEAQRKRKKEKKSAPFDKLRTGGDPANFPFCSRMSSSLGVLFEEIIEEY
jgi:hypothetical protein